MPVARCGLFALNLAPGSAGRRVSANGATSPLAVALAKGCLPPISVSLVFEGYVCFRQATRGAEMTGMGAKLPSSMKVGTGSFR